MPLSGINTILEKLLATRLVNSITRDSIIAEEQQGFQEETSTGKAVLDVRQFINSAINNNQKAV